MKIGIIGAGQIGSALTRRFRAVGHEVFVANSRGPETLAQLVAETGALAEASSERKPEWRATSASPGTLANPA